MNNSILGVCFLLFVKNGKELKLFTVEERNSKPEIFKKEGMISPPFETFEEKDGSVKETICRLIEEEIGLPLNQIEIWHISNKEFNLIPGRNDIFTTYGIGILNGDSNQARYPKDIDIIFSGWKEINELLLCDIRVETKPVIDHFIKNHLTGLLRKLSVTA